jgi:hypothetical protein
MIMAQAQILSALLNMVDVWRGKFGWSRMEDVAQNKTGRDGSVLMETVIAIPLFMILLGGIMWIGDLMVTRQKLLISDRYAVWNAGCRYNPGGWDAGTIHQRFFDSSEYRRPTQVETEKEEYDWSQEIKGGVQLDMRMPDWTRFMFNAGSVMYGSGAPKETLAMIGRSLGGGHRVLMRTKAEAEPGYIRNRYGVDESGEVTKKWRDIYREKWPYE